MTLVSTVPYECTIDHWVGMETAGWVENYEASCHVPIIIRHPDLAERNVRDDLVTLSDVTATMVSMAGARLPSYMDSVPLPGLGLAEESHREYLTGVLRQGWMITDGTWKLVRYPGGSHLFNLAEDRQEQQNRGQDPPCADVYRRLDLELTREVMRLMDEANFSGRVYTFSHSSNPDFGRVGWERIYPMPWDEVYEE